MNSNFNIIEKTKGRCFMGLTFDNPNNLQKMLDRFATVPDPKKTPKHKDPEELLNKDSKDKKKKDKK